MDLTPNHQLKSFIKVTRRVEGKNILRSVQLPQILKEGNNYVGIVTLENVEVREPMVAFLLDLVEWGTTHLSGLRWSAIPTSSHELLDTIPHFHQEAPGGLKLSHPISFWFKTRNAPVVIRGARGTRCLYFEGKEAGNGFDAACYEAVWQGAWLKVSDNGLYNFQVDDSPERIQALKKVIDSPRFPPIVSDTQWSVDRATGNPSRGITDYNRYVRFAASLTTEELEVYREYLSLDKCPGWTGVNVSKVSEEADTYRFRTTQDSSD